MNSNEIRSAFLDFFKSKEHTIVPSAPMVVKNDPTLMFTNAGMNQFKDIFLGNKERTTPRAADSQKCLRVSGKHNDLEEVGRDTYHHTMFEMLGNWSFGDYFKKEAIAWAWEFLTEVMKLDKNRLYATVFQGDAADKTEPDEEARAYWREFLPEDRILYGNKKDNFWEMGDTGPCGPCSEIHIDLRPEAERKLVPGASLVNKDNPLVIEIWNLVFMQFNRLASGELKPLSAKHVDTGMGFERLCMAVQGKTSNYDTDVFQPLIQKIASLSGRKYGDDTNADIALRVIADHTRAISFAIADGQLPSNVGAGYVIRRILRRAVRYGYTFLGFSEPFICTLVDTLAQQMGGQYPELKQQQALIEKVVKEEETAFLKTLASGIAKFDAYCQKSYGGTVVDGAFAFELFDTYGFPIDLTQLLATEKNMTVDMDGFNKGLAEQKQRSRAAAAVETEDWVELIADVKNTVFVGYDTQTADCKVVKYRCVKTKGKQFFQIVLDQTPFYAESGGQVGDVGTLENGNEKIEIVNTVKENNLTVHIAVKLPSSLEGVFTAKVNHEKRVSVQNNHSATHLIHFALRSVLGTHVEQKGSLVTPERLRFDFSHFAKVTDEEMARVEGIVNGLVRANSRLEESRNVPIDEARAMGAMALFGEKYGNEVRVIKFGDSIELCGGTHTPATGNIGLVKIVAESAIAAGVRRIEAVTGKYAEEYVNGYIRQVEELKAYFNGGNVIQSVQKLSAENEAIKKEVEAFRAERIKNVAAKLAASGKEVNGINVVSELSELDAETLRQIAYQLRGELSNTAVVLATKAGGKPSLVVAFSDDLVAAGHHAGKVVREAAALIQGGGGGQPALATAGGKNPDTLKDALEKAVALSAC
ncbi:MAG: alanine--tRNA ligase [Bacteroidales bacterium]|nr:alanine--tRNA ligase [Bacteroidales bacterium]